MFYEVVIDREETANKCTILPLSYRSDFRLFRVRGNARLGPLTSPILLHHQGMCFTQIKESLAHVDGIASVDCVWRRLDGLVRRLEGVPPLWMRIPDGFVTAYPRRSHLDTDPAGGLATIEAIFVAGALLGRWDASLLSEYYFGRQFVEMNRDRLVQLGVHQAADEKALPAVHRKTRNSRQRRQDRSRFLVAEGFPLDRPKNSF